MGEKDWKHVQASIFGLNLMSHSIRCDLSIARHEFKMGTICERFRPKNYRLASTSGKISVQIMVICFVERSKNRMWAKREHLSGRQLTDALQSTPCQSRLVFNKTIHSDRGI